MGVVVVAVSGFVSHKRGCAEPQLLRWKRASVQEHMHLDLTHILKVYMHTLIGGSPGKR